MKSNLAKASKLLVCFLAIIFVVTGCGCDKKEEKKEAPKVESKVTTLEDQTIEGLKITGFSITYSEGISKIVANVENTTDQEIKLTNIGINLLPFILLVPIAPSSIVINTLFSESDISLYIHLLNSSIVSVL